MASSGSQRRGAVWKYFKEMNQFKAKCELCEAVLSLKGGTANLSRHLLKKHDLQFASAEEKSKTNSIIIATIESLQENTIPDEAEAMGQTTEIESQTVIEYAEVPAQESEIERQTEEQLEIEQAIPAVRSSSRKRSHIWAVFDQIQPNKVRCKVCQHVHSNKGLSTGNMLRHIRLKHPELIVIDETAIMDYIPTSDNKSPASTLSYKKPKLAEEQLNTDEVLVNLLKSRLSASKKTPLDELSVEVRSFVLTIGAKLQTIPATKRNKLEAQMFALVSAALEDPLASEESQTE